MLRADPTGPRARTGEHGREGKEDEDRASRGGHTRAGAVRGCGIVAVGLVTAFVVWPSIAPVPAPVPTAGPTTAASQTVVSVSVPTGRSMRVKSYRFKPAGDGTWKR